MFSPAEMAKITEDGAVYKATKHQLYSFISAILAGGFIGLAFVFYTTTQTGTADVAWGLSWRDYVRDFWSRTFHFIYINRSRKSNAPYYLVPNV